MYSRLWKPGNHRLPSPHGNRVLAKEHLEKVALSSSDFKPFTLDIALESGFLLEKKVQRLSPLEELKDVFVHLALVLLYPDASGPQPRPSAARSPSGGL